MGEVEAKGTEITTETRKKTETKKPQARIIVSSPDIREISPKGDRCLWTVGFEKEKF